MLIIAIIPYIFRNDNHLSTPVTVIFNLVPAIPIALYISLKKPIKSMLLPESYFVDLYENFRLVCKQMGYTRITCADSNRAKIFANWQKSLYEKLTL
jgi:hypothetical protein